jgi:glycerophosphoryl diester phosphodiesterase
MAQAEAPRLIAHRFGRAYGPDSSRQALSRAIEAPIVGVETDCCLTKDGKVVLLHELLLGKATTLSGWAWERTAEEICAAELLTQAGEASGQHPLLLEEGLDLLSGRDLVKQLEIKAYADDRLALATVEAVLGLLATEKAWREGTEIVSFWPDPCRCAAARGFPARPIVACAYAPEAMAQWAREASIAGVILEGAYFSERPVRLWRQAGLSVMSGVVNTASELRRVLPFSPDMIATDRPAELLDEIGGDAH